jgi:hypothetical protein
MKATRPSQNSRAPFPLLRNFQLHAPPDGLRKTELAPQHLHLQLILCLAPLY